MNTLIQGADLTSEPPTDYKLGYFDYQARTAFRDLCRLHGFEEARVLMAQIINDEARGKRVHG